MMSEPGLCESCGKLSFHCTRTWAFLRVQTLCRVCFFRFFSIIFGNYWILHPSGYTRGQLLAMDDQQLERILEENAD